MNILLLHCICLERFIYGISVVNSLCILRIWHKLIIHFTSVFRTYYNVPFPGIVFMRCHPPTISTQRPRSYRVFPKRRELGCLYGNEGLLCIQVLSVT